MISGIFFFFGESTGSSGKKPEKFSGLHLDGTLGKRLYLKSIFPVWPVDPGLFF